MFVSKKNQDKPLKKSRKRKNEPVSAKGLRWKKRLLGFLLLLTFFILCDFSSRAFINYKNRQIKPEIDRAVIQISRIMPQLIDNEKELRDTYAMMEESRKEAARVAKSEAEVEVAVGDSVDVEELIVETLSWMQRVTKFKVGRDGTVMVVSKEDGTILAHPDQSIVGLKMTSLIFEGNAEGEEEYSIPRLEDIVINSDQSISNIELVPFLPDLSKIVRNADLRQIVKTVLRDFLYGSVVSYEDFYIVCGIPFLEFIEDGFLLGVYVSFIITVFLWVFVKYIGMLLDVQREGRRALLSRLLTCTVLLTICIFLLTWYIQVIASVTKDIKTMSQHANVALDTLSTYKEQRQRINDWLDGQYLQQCRIAADYAAKNEGKLTRQSLQKLSDVLCVKHIYVFDKEGRVLVTNSPYDHFRISENDDDQSSAFRPMLQGADHVIQALSRDEVTGDYTQFIAVGLRDGEDLYNGFVQIAVDPGLRDSLIEPLSVESVLNNLVIGLPKYAVAINKEDMTIAATTGLGFVGQPVSEINISEENLLNNFNGFLQINGTGYYAGSSEASDLFLVPIIPRTRSVSTLLVSLTPTAISLAAMLLMSFLSLIGYHRKEEPAAMADGIEGSGKQKAKEEAGSGGDGDQAAEKAKEADDEADDEIDEIKEEAASSTGMAVVSGLSRFLKAQEKANYNERWRMNNIPVSKQTPEQRIGTIIYRLILVFCLIVVVPQLYHSINGGADANDLRGLSYVVSGNWEKGFNIFSFSTLFLLLCEMYVFVMLMNQILYRLGKITDMRTETICLLIKNSLKYVCVIIFVFYGLSMFGVKTNTLWTSAGILSVVIGFGAKDLMNDLISGFFIIFEGSFKVGDFVTIGSWRGNVQEIGLRTTRVGFLGDTKIINNSSIREVVNADGQVVGIPITIPVSYDQDLERIEDTLKEALPGMMDSIPGLLEPPNYQGVDSFEDSSVMLRVMLTTDRKNKMSAKRAFLRQIKILFDREGISIPYSQIVVHYADADGEKEN